MEKFNYERPALSAEEQALHTYSTMTDQQLEYKAQQFISMMNDPTTLPQHRAIAARHIDHIAFETTYRDAFASQKAPDNLEGWE